MPGDNAPHASMSFSLGEVDQIIAEYRDRLTKAVVSAREHFDRCDQAGCPGQHVIHELTHLVAEGPSHALTALALAVYYLARHENLLDPFELEVLLNDGDLSQGGVQQGGSNEPPPQSP